MFQFLKVEGRGWLRLFVIEARYRP